VEIGCHNDTHRQNTRSTMPCTCNDTVFVAGWQDPSDALRYGHAVMSSVIHSLCTANML
jgi:hypothetical protein